MAVEPFVVRNLRATQDKLPAFDQLMHIIANAYMYHVAASLGPKRMVARLNLRDF
jgi:hypothetical protein